jgi:hypothetical protein
LIRRNLCRRNESVCNNLNLGSVALEFKYASDRLDPSIVPGAVAMLRTSISWSTIGRVYRETDLETADLDTVILDLLEGQFAWSPSAPLKGSRKISQKRSHKSCAVDVTCIVPGRPGTLRLA